MSAEHAAREAIARCASQPGKALVSLGKCQRSYFKCGADNTLLMCVRSSDVFSEAVGGCAPRSRVAECRHAATVRAKQISASNAPSSQAKYATAAANETPAAAKTCGERADGFYQHRQDCARIIQVEICSFVQKIPQQTLLVLQRRSVRISVLSKRPRLQRKEPRMRQSSKCRRLRPDSQQKSLSSLIFNNY